MVTKIGATVALIGWLGLPGVAVATLLAVTAQTLWLRVAVARRHGTEPSSRGSLAFLAICVLVAVGTVVFVPQTYGWNVARFVLGALWPVAVPAEPARPASCRPRPHRAQCYRVRSGAGLPGTDG